MRIRLNNVRNRNRSKVIIKYCLFCGKEIIGKIASAEYCNPKCRYFWRKNNQLGYKDMILKSINKNRKKLINIIIEYYGGKCACCGENNLLFLTVDHKNNNGQEDRTNNDKRRVGGSQLYYRIINNNFPSDYQILCMNCNWGKHRNKGICPHKQSL